ncbi:MAG: DNA-directed RNA polymerase subunit omega [Crocinitomicaceae bacterium]
MNFKNTNAARTTITRSFEDLEKDTNNIYETIVILAKRANQISVEMKEELTQKLTEFASHTDNLEEIFENKEQIEISKFYERLPKPNAYAIEEWQHDGTYFRGKEVQEEK